MTDKTLVLSKDAFKAMPQIMPATPRLMPCVDFELGIGYGGLGQSNAGLLTYSAKEIAAMVLGLASLLPEGR